MMPVSYKYRTSVGLKLVGGFAKKAVSVNGGAAVRQWRRTNIDHPAVYPGCRLVFDQKKKKAKVQFIVYAISQPHSMGRSLGAVCTH